MSFYEKIGKMQSDAEADDNKGKDGMVLIIELAGGKPKLKEPEAETPESPDEEPSGEFKCPECGCLGEMRKFKP